MFDSEHKSLRGPQSLKPEILAQPVALRDVRGLQLLELPQQICSLPGVEPLVLTLGNYRAQAGHMAFALRHVTFGSQQVSFQHRLVHGTG